MQHTEIFYEVYFKWNETLPVAGTRAVDDGGRDSQIRNSRRAGTVKIATQPILATEFVVVLKV